MATAELGINIVARNQARGVLKGLQGDLKGIQSSLGSVMKIAAGNLIATGISRGIQAVTSGISSAIDLSAEFSAQMSGIQAVLGGTASDLSQLKKLSLDLGLDPNLKVSSVEAAQAIEMLARNGLKLPAIMGGAAKATVLLANSTGADFATAADIGTDAMAVFGIKAENMIGAVDGITSVVNNSKFSIDDYALGIAQGGATAASSGVEFNDFNTYLAGTASLFKSGSDSGTAFKAFLNRLTPSTNAAMDEMLALGLVTADGTNAFYDATGSLREMDEISGILDRSLSGLTEKRRSDALETIFGTDANRSAIGLMKLGEQGFRDLQIQMEKTSAVDSAAVRVDNLAGDMEKYRSVVESVTLQMTDAFDPAMRAFYQTATSVLSRLAPAMISFTSKVGQGISNGIADITAYKNGFSQLFSFFGDDKTSGFLAALGKLTGAKVDVPIGAKVINVDWGLLKTSFDSAKKDLSISIGDFITGTFNLADYTATLSISDVFTGSISLKDRIVKLSIGDFFTSASMGAGGKLKFTFNETNLEIDFGALQAKVASAIKTLPAGIYAAVGGLAGIDFGAVTTRIVAQIKALPTAIYTGMGGLTGIDFSALATRISEQLKSLPSTIYAAAGGLAGIDFSDLSGRIAGQIKTIPTKITSLIGVDASGVDFTTIATEIGIGIKAAVALLFGETGAMSTVQTLVNTTLTNISTALAGIDTTTITDRLNGAIGGVLGVLKNVTAISFEGKSDQILALSSFATSVINFLKNFASGVDTETMATAASGMVANIGKEIKKTFADPTILNLGTSVGSFVSTIIEKIGSTLSAPNFGQELGQGVGDALSGVAIGAASLATGVLDELAKVDWGKFSTQVTGFLNNFVSGLASSIASQDFTPVAQAMLTALGNTFGKLLLSGTATGGGRGDEVAQVEAATAKAPEWIASLLEWRPPQPEWVNEFKMMDKAITAPSQSEMAPLLQMNAPTIDADFWPAYTTWEWPTYTTWAWPSYPSWEWPSISKPGWISSLEALLGISAQTNARTSARKPSSARPGFDSDGTFNYGFEGNAKGTDFFSGGWTWVGEKGPELLNLPRGSQILSNSDSKKMIGNMAEGTGLPTGGGGFLDSFAQIIGFGMSLLDNSLATATDTNEALSETLATNTEAVDAATTAAQNAQTAANTNAGTIATAGDMIRVSAQQFAMAATNSGSFVLNGVAHFTESFSELLNSFGDGLESALGNVPGLMGTSEVTADQMKLASLGIDQNFADDWIRRLTDEVVNGVDWEGVDIGDAAKRAGINPNLPAETILELVKQSWNDKSLFADKSNLDLFNMDAVQAALMQQQQQAAGQANVLSLFGITPEQATASGVAAGTSMRAGVATGLTTATDGGDLGASLATGITDGMTPEDFAIIGTTAIDSITTEFGKPEYAQAMLAAVVGLFSDIKGDADAFIDIARDIVNQIAGALGSVTDVDMVGKLASSMRANLAMEESINTLKDIGERILEYVFQGYSDAAKDKNWAYATVGSAPEGNTTSVGANATGTRNWRGGLSWVGEQGPELVELPRGSNVYSNRESMAMAGAGGVNVTVNVASVSTAIDIERMAHRIADVIQRRRS